jgi:hypothetical protein
MSEYYPHHGKCLSGVLWGFVIEETRIMCVVHVGRPDRVIQPSFPCKVTDVRLLASQKSDQQGRRT